MRSHSYTLAISFVVTDVIRYKLENNTPDCMSDNFQLKNKLDKAE